MLANQNPIRNQPIKADSFGASFPINYTGSGYIFIYFAVANVVPPSRGRLPAAGGFDGGDVDLAHGHHRGKSAFGLRAAGGDGFGERARGDLP